MDINNQKNNQCGLKFKFSFILRLIFEYAKYKKKIDVFGF